MNWKFPDDVANLLMKGEAPPGTDPKFKSEENYQRVNLGKSTGCKHSCGQQDVSKYCCDFCDKSFGRKDRLQRHVTVIH